MKPSESIREKEEGRILQSKESQIMPNSVPHLQPCGYESPFPKHRDQNKDGKRRQL